MIPKRNINRMLFVLIIMLILGDYLEVNAQTQITSISTSQASIVASYGSTEGGTYVYIKGSGFSTQASQNIVKIGPYPCILLASGAKQDGLSCQTTRAYDVTQRWGLYVSVEVQGTAKVTCQTSQCQFSYVDSSTPFIQEVSPRTAIGDQQVTIWGRHRITDPGDQRSNGVGQIKALQVNDIVCSTLDVTQQDDVNGDSRDYLRCKVFKDQQAGQYSFKEHVDPGYARFDVRALQTSLFTGNNYTERVAPKISSLPFHVGGSKGHEIQITGSGFTKNLSNYECKVAGQDCSIKSVDITKLTVVVPPLNVSNTDLGALPKDSTQTTTQQNKFLGSNGFRYTKYTIDTWKSITDWFTYLRSGSITLTVEADQIRTELRSPQIQDTKYLEYWRGYFYAPVNGTYQFAGIADDAFGLQISSVQNSANLANLQTLITNGYSGDDFNPYTTGAVSAIESKNLSVGYYYVEIANFNWGGSGDFRILVDMPQIHTKTTNPTWQVDQVIILPQATTPQILDIKITKSAIGVATSFSIAYFETGSVSYSASVPYGATADRFKTQLGNLPYYTNYDPTVTLTTKDSSGAITSTPALIDSYTYRLTFNHYRNPITLLRQFYSSKATFTRVQNHSKPITGNYSIKIGTYDLALYSDKTKNYSVTSIPYSTADWNLQSALNNLYQTDQIRVRLMQDCDYDQNIKFVVEYVGVLIAPLPITVTTTQLLGGNGNLFTNTVTIKRPFSLTRPLYSPLPYDFMRTAESSPQLYLTVNKIPAVCSACQYTFDASKTPSIATAALSTDTLSLTTTDPGAVGFGLTDLKITLNGQRCNVLAGTARSLTCKFNKNSLNNAALPAGSNKPIVHISQVGYADTTSVSVINIPLTITSVTPAVAGINGGTQGRIVGIGFPISDKSSIQLSLCGNNVTNIIQVTNELIVFQIPKATTTCSVGGARLLQAINSTVTVGTATQLIPQANFTFDATIIPVVSSLSKVSSSPIIKTTLTITGQNFTNQANTRVFLVNSTGFRSYQLTVNSVTSTQIQCILGGGRTGTYNVVILDAISGESSKSLNTVFNYQLIVDSISPTSGSLGGGYDITITGRNFGSADSHTVFVGDAQNTVCIMKSATATQIVCTVPRIDSSYTPGTSVNVTVTGRLLEQSICKGTCGFTYDSSVTNVVTIPSVLTYVNGDIVTITGTGLAGASVKVGTTSVTLNTTTATSLSFAYPALKYGTYEVKILTSTGYTHPAIWTTTNLALGYGISRSSGSLNGHILSVAGNGLPATVDQYLSVILICGWTMTPLDIISVVPNVVTFQNIPSATAKQCQVKVTYEATSRIYNYNYSTSQTYNSSIVQGASNTYTITSNDSVDTVSFQYLSSQNTPTSSVYPATVTKTSATTYSAIPTGGYLPNGKFKVLVHSTFFGYHTVTPTTFTKTWGSNPTFTAISSTFAGGKQIIITGAGFLTSNIQNNQIQVCGLKAKVIDASQSTLTLSVPPLVTTVTQGLYTLIKPDTIVGTLISDTPQKANNALDGKVTTSYVSNNSNCYVGFNFGANAKADIQFIKYMPTPDWAIPAAYLQGAKFQGSNDNNTWTEIFTVDTKQVHSSWNYWPKPLGATIQYQYVRFSHTNVSRCQLAQLQINGIIYSTMSVTNGVDKLCDIVIKGPTDITLTNAVTYSHAKTSTISSLSSKFGPSVGGTILTITGTNFGTTLSVKIDGIDCAITANNTVSITCTTGVRATIPSTNSFIVTSDGNPVLVQCDPFLYIDRWSSQDTWGGESIPRQGDSVYVPKGMSLLVDVASTPVLDSIIVQGRIQFSDQLDQIIDAHYFIISGGEFIAGTQSNRYQHKLTITLHGGYYDKQLPIFGNKVLGCRNCKFSLHGELRTPTWTELKSTVDIGATTLEVMEPVDWRVGQSIVIASSSFDHYEAEQMTIASISANKTVITVVQTFKYRHYAAVQMYDGVQFPMRAEVGLLTRNIKIQGDSTSADSEYGSHMMMSGKKATGLVASFSYAQITNCGQPKIIGCYCSHFHMTGQMPQSSVRGMAVHHSFARVLTIHATHFVTVEKNVGYHVKGHNIFIQDGIETNNVIQDNLIISSISSFTLLQSDISVASYWITNPYNTVRRNHAAGSDFYGFWYEIKQYPDGPSATSDICPMGMQVGQSRDNVAHSNVRFGLRIFKLSARKFPCVQPQDDGLLDPYTANVAIQSVFDNYTLWRNAECGFLGQQLGFTTIQNFKTADSKKGGMQFHKTNFTKELVTAKNCLIVGYSQGNPPTDIDTTYNQARGFIASRTDGLKASGIRFYNFGANMTPLQSCSQCYSMKLWVVGSKTTFFENITYVNVTGNYIFWQKWRRQVFIDLDGTLLQPAVTALGITAQVKGSITPYRASVTIPTHCYEINGSSWNHSTYCDSTITLRSILFTNAIPEINFNAINIKAHRLNTPYDNFTQLQPTEDTFSEEYMIIIKKSYDIKKSWAMPFVVGQYYNIHWKWGIDFTHLAIAPSRLWNTNQSVVLRFNYTDTRQLYEIGKWYQAQLQLPFIVPKSGVPDLATCQNGDYYNNYTARYLFVCVTGRNKAIHQWVDVNGIRCRYNCPQDSGDGTRQDAIRFWSDTTNWENGILPQQGDNVTIPYAWKMVINVDVPKLNYLQINGILMFELKMNHTFEAHYIWVRKGIWRLGSSTDRYTNIATIILHGQKDDPYLVLDPDASGNKMLAVTGELQFYGNIINNTWTKLTSIAQVGDTTIQVINAADWNIGDKIVIGPTYSGTNDDQVVTITDIRGTTITFTPALTHEHYGATAPITNIYGVLDTRAGVGLLSRNIRITKGPDANGWGCRILAYSYQDFDPANPAIPTVIRTGNITFDGVEVDSCGQYDTNYAGVRFKKLGNFENNWQKSNIITRSSFHSSNGMGMWIANTTNIRLQNNLFHNAKKFLVYVEYVNNYTFTNNLLIGARSRPELASNLSVTVMVDDVACYEQYTGIDFTNDNVSVTNNLAQGSQTGEGFVFPFAPCDRIDTYNFGGNTAGSCIVAIMLNKDQDYQCLAAARLIGYASQIGLMANPTTSGIKMIYQQVIFADNQRGITLRYGHDIDENTIIVRNSYFAGFSRPDCPTCYADDKIKYCKNGYAVRMFAATISGQGFPLVKENTYFDVICTRQAYDMKSFFNNVTFENYKDSNTAVPYCTDMSVFRRHNIASDSTGSAYLTNTVCINCQQNAWGWFEQPNTAWRGWFGGCGQFDCTGPNNYIIYDQDGSFTGKISQILANNSMVGSGESSCTFNAKMNGYYCLTDQLAVMEYESIAPDFDLRIMWPVQLKYDTGNWTSKTNGWRQWQWQGPEPLNRRLARFVSVVKLHNNFNLSYAGQPPTDTRFQIQKRLLPTGNATDWVIIRIYYPLPNSLQVLVKNTTGTDIVVKPFTITNGVRTDLRNYTDVCGANNFHYDNGTIEFVLNGKDNCQVRVRLSNYVKLSARLSIPVLDFYNNNGPTTFITNICAFLNIDPGRLKIVGIRNGSIVIDAYITSPTVALSSSTVNSTTTTADQYSTLSAMAASISTALSAGHVDVGAPILGVSTQVGVTSLDGTVYTPPPAQASSDKSKMILIIVLATVIPVIVILIIVAGYCFIKRRRERISSVSGESESHLSNESTIHKTKRDMIKVSQIPFEINKMQDIFDKY